MPEAIRTRWRSALLEGVGVLIGILIAFGIDAWWDARGERQRERTYLKSLRAELAHARRAIQDNKAALLQEIRISTTRATLLSAPSAASFSSDSVYNLTRGVSSPIPIFTPPRAVLDDMIYSGGIVLIRSDSLRRALASYEQALARDLREQEKLDNIFLMHIAPYRYRYGSMQGVADFHGMGDLAIQIDPTAFARNRMFVNLVLARTVRLRDVTEAHDSVIVWIDRIAPLLNDR